MYAGKDTNETRTFCREYGDTMRHFLDFHKQTLIRAQIVFLPDNRSSFRHGSSGIVENLGFGEQIFYPASVQQFRSPNGNSLHGVVKAEWRSLFTDFDDDVTASIALMKCLDDSRLVAKTSSCQVGFSARPGSRNMFPCVNPSGQVNTIRRCLSITHGL